jgi:hypothetical protein
MLAGFGITVDRPVRLPGGEGGAVGSLGGASCLYEGLIYFERDVDARYKIYISVGSLLG